VRVRLKGLNFSRKRLADGTLRTYWYAWRNGPLLRGEPGTPEFVASYNAAVTRKVMPSEGTLLSLLQGYQASDNFRRREPRTQRDYIAKIKIIEKQFGDLHRSSRLPNARSRTCWSGCGGHNRGAADWGINAVFHLWSEHCDRSCAG
jgi:hypothetical protein